MSKWHGGKGSAPRKGNNQKQYEDNWERIFAKKSQLDYSIYTDYDHREETVKLFSDLTDTEQAFHKMGNTTQWQVYCTALKYVKQAEDLQDEMDSGNWPPIKLQKDTK